MQGWGASRMEAQPQVTEEYPHTQQGGSSLLGGKAQVARGGGVPTLDPPPPPPGIVAFAIPFKKRS